MVSQQLIDYIKHQQEQGKSKEEITAALHSQGWQQADVDQGFMNAASGIPAPMNAELPKAGQIFKEAWGIYKTKFKTLVSINAVPTALAFIFGLIVGFASVGLKDNPADPKYALIAVGVVFLIGVIYLSLWSTMATIFAAADQGGDAGFSGYFHASKNKIGAFFLTGLLVGLAVMGGTILLIIPGIIFGFWFSQYPYIVAEENLSGVEAMKRSKYYIKGRIGTAFGKLFYLVVIGLLLSILVSILQGIVGGLAAGAGPDNITYIQAGIRIIFNLLWTPLTVVYAYLVYKYLRATRP